jgi:hypothetical protein
VLETPAASHTGEEGAPAVEPEAVQQPDAAVSVDDAAEPATDAAPSADAEAGTAPAPSPEDKAELRRDGDHAADAPAAEDEAVDTADAPLVVAAASKKTVASRKAAASRKAPAKPASAARQPPLAVTQMIEWVRATHDNGDLPFVIIDKVAAKVFVYDAEGRFLGATPALLGFARGDDSITGIGDRELSDIKPADRTTPAGRFVAAFGRASGNKTVLWVDYATAISLHPVVYANKKEKRLERLVSPSAKDNRITFGCINVSYAFYNKVIRPLFTGTSGVVYILPEAKPMDAVFPSFRVMQAQPEPGREGIILTNGAGS